MNAIEEKIIDLLATIKGGGDFVASGTKDLIMPAIEVKGFGELAMPITSLQAKNPIKVAHKAPFGKGSKTILDDEVRKSWEIDVSEISFKNPAWDKWVEEVVAEVKEKLGVGNAKVKASLCKMLIYEKGDFFTWHKDSEKEPNMFATLSITLPSNYTGGELAVRFQGAEVVVDLAKDSKEYKFTYTAFYADCDHEIRPLTEGYRVSLVYNLLQTSKKNTISAFDNIEKEAKLAKLFREWQESFGNGVKVVLLGHQYAPTNFAASQLKLADKPRVQMLLKAAENAGFFARLALLTHYQSGDIDYESIKPKQGKRRSWDYEDYDDDELSSSTIGEIYEEYMKVEDWAEEGLPTLGSITIEDNMILSKIVMGEDEPIEKQAEGYTGNAGMTIDYWYYYGAVVLWNEESHTKELSSLLLSDSFEWLKYYVDRKDKDKKAVEYLKIILDTLQVEEGRLSSMQNTKDLDATGVIDTWTILKDEQALTKSYANILPLFIYTSYESWARLIESYSADMFNSIFKGIVEKNRIAHTAHWIGLCAFLQKDKTHQNFIDSHIKNCPTYLAHVPTYLSHKTTAHYHHVHVRNMLNAIIEISTQKQTKEWIDAMTTIFTSLKERAYINDVLLRALVESPTFEKSTLYQNLYTFGKQDLKTRVKNKPQPLPNWTRPIPEYSSYYKKTWESLQNFMASPIQQIYNYQAIQANRSAVEYAIKDVVVDLDMNTIRKGLPHTL